MKVKVLDITLRILSPIFALICGLTKFNPLVILIGAAILIALLIIYNKLKSKVGQE